MKRLTLFVLLLIAALAVAGCGLVATGDQAAERAAEIAQFELPAGFSPEAGVSLAGTTMVTYSHSDGRSHIFLIQAPGSSGMTAAQLEQSLRDSLASSQGAGAVEMQDTEEVPLTIRGEQVTALPERLVISQTRVLEDVALAGRHGVPLSLVPIDEQ